MREIIDFGLLLIAIAIILKSNSVPRYTVAIIAINIPIDAIILPLRAVLG